MKKIWLLGLGFFFIFIGFNGAQYHMSSYFAAAGHPETAFFILMLTYGFFGLGALFSSKVIQIGLKRSMLIAIPFYGLFIASLSFQSYVVYICAALAGLAAAVLWNAQMSYLVEASDAKDYGKNSGLFFTLMSLGSALGIVIFGFMLSKSGFLALGLISLIGMAFIWMLPEIRAKAKRTELSGVLKKPKVLASLAVFLGNFFAMGISIGIVPLYLGKVLGPEYTWLTFLFFIMTILMSYALGWLSDLIGRSKIILVSGFLIAIGFGMVLLEQPIMLILALIPISLVNAVLIPTGSAVIGDISTAKSRDSVAAFLLIIENIGGVAAFLISAYIAPSLAIILGIIIMVATATISYLTVTKTRV